MASKTTSENMNYIKNKNLLEELRVYKETGERTEELGRMFLLLAQRYSDRGSFAGYSWKDDMICEAVLTCIKYMHNFDVDIDNPNPFAYFSRIIHNSFLNYIAKQKVHSKIKDICYKNIDFITPDSMEDDDRKHFDICGINYQQIRGNKKKKRKKAKK
jgi:DNA-directed RNA polymerase specialized sigma24 family protein